MTKKLTTSAMMIALSAVLSLITVYKAAYGGSVTAASMVPIILIGFIYGTKWGIMSGFVYALLQMLTGGIAPPPVQTFGMYALVILLDYVIAFTVLGLSGFFYSVFRKKSFSIPLSAAIVMLFRFICHFLSGILIWSVYAPEGMNIWVYSLLYNGGYMLPEIVISTIVLCMLIV
ncbi:MAG: energy-coupled thiamine transporter ThiT, partial [Clostridia bacterium]|nr:energy-coupled thiamine transporter ThiT [Clostridia bacterium]